MERHRSRQVSNGSHRSVKSKATSATFTRRPPVAEPTRDLRTPLDLLGRGRKETTRRTRRSSGPTRLFLRQAAGRSRGDRRRRRRAAPRRAPSGMIGKTSLASTGQASLTPGSAAEPFRQAGREAVRVAGIAEPVVVLRNSPRIAPRSAGPSRCLAGPLAPIVRGLRERHVEHHHRLGHQAAVLGGAEGQDVDAAPSRSSRPALAAEGTSAFAKRAPSM